MGASNRLDRASADEARSLLSRCCAARRWVEAMLARRPFVSDARLLAIAREVWLGLGADDWREAFAHHPKIGDRAALAARFAATRELSLREQAGVRTAPDAVLDALERGNQIYQARFGYIFIVCATGKSADEMLSMLETRLTNPPEVEIRVAAEEQSQITALRLMQIADVPTPGA
jgi:2-oxo-4-hydroxy-4-carboxy-5-ureidoimidazoline decarboxylase